MAKNTPDHLDTWATFVLDLRGNIEWWGEMGYGSKRVGKKRDKTFAPSRFTILQLNAPIGYTSSQKINTEATCNLTIYVGQETNDEFIGFAEKRKTILNVVVWLPWDDALLFHQILMAGRCEMLEISGTDLYRSKASIRKIGISGKYDLDD